MPAQRADIHGPARAAFGVLEVEACAERIGAASEHYRRGSAVVFKTPGGVGELPQRFRRQRVDAVATVEAHHGDAPLGPETLFDRHKVRQVSTSKSAPPCPLFSCNDSSQMPGWLTLGFGRGKPGTSRVYGAIRGSRNKEHRSMGLSYRWVIVGAGALMTCVGIGAMFSLAVYLQPMSMETGWSRAGISSAMTIDFLTMGIAGFGWGAASDRFGTRPVVLSGAVLLGLGLFLASRSASLIEFQLTYGILVGLAAGAFFAPMIAAATRWFDNNRSLAVSLVSAGMGVAPMTISPMARWLISTYDWRTAMMTVGIIAWALLIPAALLVRRPPETASSGAVVATGSSDSDAGMSVAQ